MLHSFHFYAKHYCASTYIGFFFFPPTSFKLARFHLLLYFDTLLCSAQVSGKFNAFLLLKVLESWKNWDIRWHRTRSIENLKSDTCKKISYLFCVKSAVNQKAKRIQKVCQLHDLRDFVVMTFEFWHANRHTLSSSESWSLTSVSSLSVLFQRSMTSSFKMYYGAYEWIRKNSFYSNLWMNEWMLKTN